MSFSPQLDCLQVIYSEEERKYNKDITLGLIRSELLNLAEYNVHMAKLIDGGRNSKWADQFYYCCFFMSVWTDHLCNLSEAATEFAISLLQTLVVEESSIISELHNLVDALAKVRIWSVLLEDILSCYFCKASFSFDLQVAAKPGSSEPLQQLVEIIKNPSASTAAISGVNIGKEDKTRLARDKKVSLGEYYNYYNIKESFCWFLTFVPFFCNRLLDIP